MILKRAPSYHETTARFMMTYTTSLIMFCKQSYPYNKVIRPQAEVRQTGRITHKKGTRKFMNFNMRPCSFTMVFIDEWISCFQEVTQKINNRITGSTIETLMQIANNINSYLREWNLYMYLELSLKLKLLVRRRSPNDALCRVPIHAKQLFHCKDLCFRKF